MINNRQNGRRRGRGGVRPPNGAGGNDRGSRIDNRSRGNAAQLYEKYKALARDTQMQGDRVMTEYYLQFADHYFRVLNENRSRFEEQNQRRPQNDFDDFGDDDGDGDGMDDAPEPAPRYAQEQQGQRRDRYPRQGDETQGGGQNGASNGRQGYANNDRGFDRGQDRNQADRNQADRNQADRNQADRNQDRDGSQRHAERQNGRDAIADNGGVQQQRREAGPDFSRDASRDAGDGYRAMRAAPEQQPAASVEDDEAPRPRRARRPRVDPQAEAPRIEVDRLPPAFAPAAAAPVAGNGGEQPSEAAPRRRGRPRRSNSDGTDAAVEA